MATNSQSQPNKEYETLGSINDAGVLDEVKRLWNETTCKPKIMSLRHAIDLGYVTDNFAKWTDQPFSNFFEDTWDHKDHKLLTHKHWFLHHDILEKGLWSPPNGVLRNGNFIHFHPGGNRIRALVSADLLDVDLMIWDPLNKYDSKELNFDEWLSYFDTDDETKDEKNDVWFSRVRKFIGEEDTLFMLEAHITQGLDKFKDWGETMESMLNHTKPKLLNYYDEELASVVHFDGEEHGVEIYVKDNQTFTKRDLNLLIHVSDKIKTFENNKVIITVK